MKLEEALALLRELHGSTNGYEYGDHSRCPQALWDICNSEDMLESTVPLCTAVVDVMTLLGVEQIVDSNAPNSQEALLKMTRAFQILASTPKAWGEAIMLEKDMLTLAEQYISDDQVKRLMTMGIKGIVHAYLALAMDVT